MVLPQWCYPDTRSNCRHVLLLCSLSRGRTCGRWDVCGGHHLEKGGLNFREGVCSSLGGRGEVEDKKSFGFGGWLVTESGGDAWRGSGADRGRLEGRESWLEMDEVAKHSTIVVCGSCYCLWVGCGVDESIKCSRRLSRFQRCESAGL